MPVHVGEVRALPLGDVEDGVVLRLVEPLHGDAVRHGTRPVGQQLPRARALVDESRPLAVQQAADERRIDVGCGLHGAIVDDGRDERHRGQPGGPDLGKLTRV